MLNPTEIKLLRKLIKKKTLVFKTENRLYFVESIRKNPYKPSTSKPIEDASGNYQLGQLMVWFHPEWRSINEVSITDFKIIQDIYENNTNSTLSVS